MKIEEQHRKALEEDPSVFDYDGVYDDMKAKVAQPRALDREERKVTRSVFCLIFPVEFQVGICLLTWEEKGLSKSYIVLSLLINV